METNQETQVELPRPITDLLGEFEKYLGTTGTLQATRPGQIRILRRFIEECNIRLGELDADPVIDLIEMVHSGKTLKEIDHEAAKIALRLFRFNTTKTAKSLGIGRATFYRRYDELVGGNGNS